MAATLEQHQHTSAGDTALNQQKSGDSNQSQSLGSSTHQDESSTAIEKALNSGSNGGHNHGSTPGLPNLLVTSDGKFDTKIGTDNGDRILGGTGNDFLKADDKAITVRDIPGSGPGEFPFPNNSPGTSTLNTELKDGTFTISGDFKNFEGKPLLQGGNTQLDPNAVLPAGVDGQATIDGFVRAAIDSEGNDVFKTGAQHIHFGAPGTADATVIRNIQANPTSDSSGTFNGSFNLKPEEEAAAASVNSNGTGVLYFNAHSTIQVVGENRAEFGNGNQG